MSTRSGPGARRSASTTPFISTLRPRAGPATRPSWPAGDAADLDDAERGPFGRPDAARPGAPKATAVGRGQFVTIALEISDPAGRAVSRMRARTLYFHPAPAAPRAVTAEDGPGGLAPLRIPLTRTLIVAASLASNDHEPVHHDHEAARAQGLQDIIASIVTTAGLVLRYTGLTAGDAPCRALTLRLARPAFPGDVLDFGGQAAVTADGTRFRVRGDHARGRHATTEVSYGHRS